MTAIDIAAIAKVPVQRFWEPFSPTVTAVNNLNLRTDLAAFRTTVQTFDVYSLWHTLLATAAAETNANWHLNPYTRNQTEALDNLITASNVHIGIRVDNSTHPTPAKGVVPLAKRHMDFSVTGLEIADFTDNTPFYDAICNQIVNLAESSKYEYQPA